MGKQPCTQMWCDTKEKIFLPSSGWREGSPQQPCSTSRVGEMSYLIPPFTFDTPCSRMPKYFKPLPQFIIAFVPSHNCESSTKMNNSHLFLFYIFLKIYMNTDLHNQVYYVSVQPATLLAETSYYWLITVRVQVHGAGRSWWSVYSFIYLGCLL